MRFFEEGPSIPDQLLERRDQGRVVFLCGAGVSLNSGMPTFYHLVKYVVDFFDPPTGSSIESAFKPWVEDDESGKDRPKTPLDQIIHLLYQEYGRKGVNTLVTERLRTTTPEEINSLEHRIIAKLSSDQEGNPQIVTTNFDLLFEQVFDISKSEIYEPPALPDISLGVSLKGITYLHGRIQKENTEEYPYILSSADFGRAYLSEGWATQFISLLLKSYTVVLVGYKAEDPPVKYLLQGLNHDGLSDRSNLYAFDKGDPEDIEVKWRDRGVTPIPCKDYPSMWKTLGAWAERADDPRQWRSQVINMAMKGPRQLSSHERGQVAHLVRTTPGARLFAKTDPCPPPEWLCVFDSKCRVAKSSKNYGDEADVFDPFMEYSLDDDLPRPSVLEQESNLVHENLLEWRRGDANPPTFHMLSGRQANGFETMPPRLLHLSTWIIKNIDSPITAWWAARQNGLHPRLLSNILFELRRKKNLGLDAVRTWDFILESQSDSRNFEWGDGYYEIKNRIENESWTPSVLRTFEAVMAPKILMECPLGLSASKPPFEGWDEKSANTIASWKVKFPDIYGEKLDIPDEALEKVFIIMDRHLRRFSELQHDLDIVYFSSPTCYPRCEVEGQDYGRDEFFELFLEIFTRTASVHPSFVQGCVASWPSDEKVYFRKLRLFALNYKDLFSAEIAIKTILDTRGAL